MHDVSAEQRRLIQLIRRIGFGCVEIKLRDGEPSFEPAPSVRREWLLGARDRPIPVQPAVSADFVDLFALLKEIQQGTVVIEVRHGRAHRVIQTAAARP